MGVFRRSPKSGSYGESLTHHACACAHRIIRPSCALRTSLPMSLPRKFQTAVNAWARLLMPKRMPCRCVQEPLDLFLVQPISPPLHSHAFNVAAFGSPLENTGCRPSSPIRPIPGQSHTKNRPIPPILNSKKRINFCLFRNWDWWDWWDWSAFCVGLVMDWSDW